MYKQTRVLNRVAQEKQFRANVQKIRVRISHDYDMMGGDTHGLCSYICLYVGVAATKWFNEKFHRKAPSYLQHKVYWLSCGDNVRTHYRRLRFLKLFEEAYAKRMYRPNLFQRLLDKIW